MRRLVPTFLVLSTLCLAPAAGFAQDTEEVAWDQAKVTALAQELTEAVRKIRSAFRSDPTAGNLASMNQRAANALTENLRQLERSSRQLAKRLEEGKGREDTVAVARKIGALLRDTEVESRKLKTSASTNEAAKVAQGLIDQLAPYYGAEPLYNVDEEAETS